jgi:hypothetical protein
MWDVGIAIQVRIPVISIDGKEIVGRIRYFFIL